MSSEVGAPGVTTSATPSCLSPGMSCAGMVPPIHDDVALLRLRLGGCPSRCQRCFSDPTGARAFPGRHHLLRSRIGRPALARGLSCARSRPRHGSARGARSGYSSESAGRDGRVSQLLQIAGSLRPVDALQRPRSQIPAAMLARGRGWLTARLADGSEAAPGPAVGLAGVSDSARATPSGGADRHRFAAELQDTWHRSVKRRAL
jgi:hypothetical protein